MEITPEYSKGDKFKLNPQQKTSRQHYARQTENGSITVFDNGNENGQTRIVEYTLDEEKLALVSFNEYQIDGDFSAGKTLFELKFADPAILTYRCAKYK